MSFLGSIISRVVTAGLDQAGFFTKSAEVAATALRATLPGLTEPQVRAAAPLLVQEAGGRPADEARYLLERRQELQELAARFAPGTTVGTGPTEVPLPAATLPVTAKRIAPSEEQVRLQVAYEYVKRDLEAAKSQLVLARAYQSPWLERLKYAALGAGGTLAVMGLVAFFFWATGRGGGRPPPRR